MIQSRPPFRPLQFLLLLAVCGIAGSRLAYPQAPSTTNAERRERGIALYNQNRVPEAVEALQKAVKENKNDFEAWHFLGLALILKKDFKSATKSFEAAIKIRPDFAAAHAGLGYALLLRNKLSEAVRASQTALSIDKGIADAHYILGVAALRSGDDREALDRAERVIKLKPLFAPAYLLKSEALVSFLSGAIVSKERELLESRRARFSEAAGALEKYLQLNPQAEDRQTWVEQLEALRFYLSAFDKVRGEGVFSGPDVTTKVRVLKKPEPSYTEAARQNQITGTVILRAIFSSAGTVKSILVVSGLPFGLTERAINAARKIKFIPATLNGRPVSMFMELQYNFNLY